MNAVLAEKMKELRAFFLKWEADTIIEMCKPVITDGSLSVSFDSSIKMDKPPFPFVQLGTYRHRNRIDVVDVISQDTTSGFVTFMTPSDDVGTMSTNLFMLFYPEMVTIVQSAIITPVPVGFYNSVDNDDHPLVVEVICHDLDKDLVTIMIDPFEYEQIDSYSFNQMFFLQQQS